MSQPDESGKASGATVRGHPPESARPKAPMFCDIAKYTQGRGFIGTTMMEAPLLNNRRVHLWTVEGNEHILILEQNRSFLYWEASLEPLADAKKRACDWLTEPPAGEP